MKTSVQFRVHIYHNRFIPSAELYTPSIELFCPTSVGDSIDRTDETRLLRWAVRQPEILSLLLGSLGMAGPVGFDVEVTSPFLPRHGAGDIDLLAAPVRNPQEAVAIQAKRFKVTLGDSGDSVSLDAAKLDTLIRQCNDTIALGFDRVYGLVLIMMDGQTHPAPSLPHRRTSPATFRRLYHFLKSQTLAPGIGLAFMEIVQPTPAGFHELGFVAVGVDEPANHKGQSGEVSARVEKWTDKVLRKRKHCEVYLPPPSDAGIPIQPHESVGLRLVRRSE